MERVCPIDTENSDAEQKSKHDQAYKCLIISIQILRSIHPEYRLLYVRIFHAFVVDYISEKT